MIDFSKKEISNAPNEDPHIREFYADEAVEKADLMFFILKSDVGFVQNDFYSYVHAKLTAFGDDDVNSNGRGICEASLILYNVSSQIKASKKDSSARK